MTSHPIDPIDLSAYRDGELDPSRRRFVESHLAFCSACRERLADYAWLGDALRESAANVAVPASVDERVAAMLHARGEAGPRFALPRITIPRQAWAAAALSGILAAALLFGLPSGSGTFGPTVASAYLVEDQGTPTIKVEFSGGVDRDSIAQTVQLEPAVPVSVEWQGDTMLVRPAAPLQPTRNYTLKLNVSGDRQTVPPVALQFAGEAPRTPVPLATQAAPPPPPGAVQAPEGTETASATPTPEATATATPTVTPTSVATHTAIPSPTASEPSPYGQFEQFFRGHPAIALRLGEAVGEETVVSVATQRFQNGMLLSRSDTLETLLLRDGFEALSYVDAPAEGATEDSTPVDRTEAISRLLERDPDVGAMLGVATSPVQSTTGIAREFEGGSALWTPDGAVLVLYGKGGWERYLDGGVGPVPMIPTPTETSAALPTSTSVPADPSTTPSPTPPEATATSSAAPTSTATATETPTAKPSPTAEPVVDTPTATPAPTEAEGDDRQETATATPTPGSTNSGGSS